MTIPLATLGSPEMLAAALAAITAAAASPVMVPIAPGSFEMGKAVDYGEGLIDGPRHLVTIAKPFLLARHEVTVGEFRRFIRATGYAPSGECYGYSEDADFTKSPWRADPNRSWANPGFPQAEDHPVVCVSFIDVQAYIGWLNGVTGRRFRLPAEAEWEYVAATAWPRGEPVPAVTHDNANIGKATCCGGETGGRDRWKWTAPVMRFSPDRRGLYDIRGNAWEWMADCYDKSFDAAPNDGSARRNGCAEREWRVVKGGSWGDGDPYLEATFRLRAKTHDSYFTLGFRLAEDAPSSGQTGTQEEK